MSLHSRMPEPIPEETARVAHAAFPQGTVCMRVRDALGAVYRDDDFTDLYPADGHSAEHPWRLALVTVLQFVEHLTDRQATEAVRARIDWKYALSLELPDPGFDFTVLSQFRTRRLTGGGERRLWDRLLEILKDQGLLKARGRQPSAGGQANRFAVRSRGALQPETANDVGRLQGTTDRDV